VPQQIGVRKTKMLAIFLLFVFYMLEFLKIEPDYHQLAVNLIMVLILIAFTINANVNRGKYYTALWVEFMPVIWWLLLLTVPNLLQ
jgi:hypothetical protein